jgi:hypothetical protein
MKWTSRAAAMAVASLLLLGSGRARAAFTEGNLDDGSSSNPVGQSFQVGLEPTPNPGLSAGTPVRLDSVLFHSGGGGTGNAQTYLAIMPGAFYDFNGNPNGSFTPTVSDALGISTNAIDTTALGYGAAITFAFSGLNIPYGNVVSATFVTINGSNQLTPIPVSTTFIRFVENPPGTFNPASNYGGNGNFSATSLFPDSNGDGFFQGATNAQDLSFQASFSIPEPGSVALIVLGMGVVTLRRRASARGESRIF